MVAFPSRSAKDLRKEQLKDNNFKKIIRSFEDNADEDLAKYTEGRYLMTSDVLFRYSFEKDKEKAQMVVPAHERQVILEEYHDRPTAADYCEERTYR